MLQKKKHWTAVMQPTITNSGLPTSTSSNKMQWPTNPPSLSPDCRMQPKSSATAMEQAQASPSFSVSSSLSNRSTTSENLNTPKQRYSAVDNLSRTLPSAINRNEVSHHLLSTLANTTDLLPHDLLQLLPQEYIEKYAKNLDKRAVASMRNSIHPNTEKNDESLSIKSVPSNLNNNSQRPSSSSTDYQSLPSFQVSNVSPSTHHPQTVGGRPISVEANRNTALQKTPLNNQPNNINYPSTSFVPSSTTSSLWTNRRTTEAHGDKDWNQSPLPHLTQPQLPATFDYSTINAFAASLLQSPQQRSNAVATILSQWDPANQLALLSQQQQQQLQQQHIRDAEHRRVAESKSLGNILTSNNTGTSNNTTKSIVGSGISSDNLPVPGGGATEHRPSIIQTSVSQADIQRQRFLSTMADVSSSDGLMLNSIPTDGGRRRFSASPQVSVQQTPGDIRVPLPQQNKKQALDVNKAPSSVRTHNTSRPSECISSTLGANERCGGGLLTDSRLSILHDAKMAALSDDWSSAIGLGGGMNRNRSTTPYTLPNPPPATSNSHNYSQTAQLHPSTQPILPPLSRGQTNTSQLPHLNSPPPPPLRYYSSTGDLSSTNMHVTSPNTIRSSHPSDLTLPTLLHSTAPGQLGLPTHSIINSSESSGRNQVPYSLSTITTVAASVSPYDFPSSTHPRPDNLKPFSHKQTVPPAPPPPQQQSNFIPMVPAISPPYKTEINPPCSMKSSDESGSTPNPPSNRGSRSFMPLKKRLIQRYEADNNSSISPGDLDCKPSRKLSTSHNLASRCSPHENVDVKQPDEKHISLITSHNTVEEQNLPQKDNYENEQKSLQRRIRVPMTTSTTNNKRSGVGRGLDKDAADNLMPGSKYKRNKKFATNLDSNAPGFQKSLNRTTKRRTTALSGRSSTRSHCRTDGNEVPRRRMAALNGNLIMMVASREQRSTSSTSSRSSSSRRSMKYESDTDTSHHHHHPTYNKSNSYNLNRDESEFSHFNIPDSPTHSPTRHFSSDCLVSHGGNNSSTPIEISDRVRKPKRAAALAASAATAASVPTKRPRIVQSDPNRRSRGDTQMDDDSLSTTIRDDDSLSTDDASSIITTDSKTTTSLTGGNSSSNNNPLLDELSAVLVEDKMTLDELCQQIPGPPDISDLSNRSLHPVHSWEHYKRTRTAFVQLVSCNDSYLKQIPKCRACRQIKRSPSQFDDPAMTGSLNDGQQQSQSDEVKSSSNPPDGQFKRPSSGRTGSSATSEREKESAATDRSKSDKTRNSNKRHNQAPPISVFCRFWGFRKLVFDNRGVLKIAGFCHSTEANSSDRLLWEMHQDVNPHLSVENAKYILERSGTLFCRLLRHELAVLGGNRDREPVIHRGPGAPPKNGLRRSATSATATAARTHIMNSVAWKRPVKGVREMCDVCETTMFNTHWVCAKCGYSVCAHCQAEAKFNKPSPNHHHPHRTKELPLQNTTSSGTMKDKTKEKQPRYRAGPIGWASCTTTRQHHDPGRLLLTSLIPASTIGQLLHRVHRLARHYHIRLGCSCLLPNMQTDAHQNGEKVDDILHSFSSSHPLSQSADQANSLDLLADLALKKVTGGGCDVKPDPYSSTITTTTTLSTEYPQLSRHAWISGYQPPLTSATTDEVRSSGAMANKYRVLHLPVSETTHGLEAFQHEWRSNRPIVVSGCHDRFSSTLWTPRSFADEFGPLRTTLVDCASGLELTRYPLRTFWEGFERKSKRLVSKDGQPLCLKLKDWPTTDDFAELHPHRFTDLTNNLPMPDYTCRDGQLNMAARLTSSFFVCPDLGPKLYVAYGTGGTRSIGSTNLHVDIADAINILLYIGQPATSPPDECILNAELVLSILRDAKVDPVYLQRANQWMDQLRKHIDRGEDLDKSKGTHYGPPGALWHIFLPEDTPILRQFLSTITEAETGCPVEPGSDPIHDQLFYLDQSRLDRLHTETGVIPCTIVQFRGDSIFIPAGAAHQVRNLNSCIKAAVDFVSPEHLPRCFALIDEFRRLSSTHQNHEDKLQVKNMLFHAVKDTLATLLIHTGSTSGQVDESFPIASHLSRHFDHDTLSTMFFNSSLLKLDDSIVSSINHHQHDSSPPVSCPKLSPEVVEHRLGKSPILTGKTRTRGRIGRMKQDEFLSSSSESPHFPALSNGSEREIGKCDYDEPIITDSTAPTITYRQNDSSSSPYESSLAVKFCQSRQSDHNEHAQSN